MKLLLTMLTVLVVVPFVLGLLILLIGYQAWVGCYIWDTLAVPNGMPHIPLMVWIAASLVYSTVFSSGYSTLFANNTPEEKARLKKFYIEEIVTKPLLVLVVTMIIKLIFV